VRVLVVEDDPDLRAVLADALREDGYAVDEAADGPDASFKAAAYAYDAVVLDVMLPGKDGWRVLADIRGGKPTPVLMLTARDAPADRVKGLDGGADDYVVKPYHLGEVLARVRALIRRSAHQPTPTIAIGDVVLDTARKSVTKAGQAVALTAREYAIVEYLVRRRGQVVSRTDLYDHIFDETDDSLSNLLDVHVSHVRRKLGRAFIVTRRGLGYAVDG
jgi:two-component system OmpR family response regulator